MSAPGITCISCGLLYPATGAPYVCPACGGVFDHVSAYTIELGNVDQSKTGMWRYWHSFCLPDTVEQVSLGEGSTPLLWTKVLGRDIAFKCEHLNPTGSFKDRGSSLLATWLKHRGIKSVVEDSSGNAGASLSAYAQRAGIEAQIFVQASASGPKHRQIEALGAKMVPVAGSRSDVGIAARSVVSDRTAYASHAYLPVNLPGYATVAYEIFEQLGGKMPGTVLMPVGQGGLLLGVYRGFDALRIASNDTMQIPVVIGVQAKNCAPLWVLNTMGRRDDQNADQPTLAEGVNVRNPIRWKPVLNAVESTGGYFCITNEADILIGMKALSQLGFYVEPTSAILWEALRCDQQRMVDPIVLILTGSGNKYIA